MLLSTVFVLRPVEDCWVPMTLGKAIHACVMQMVRRLEKAGFEITALLGDYRGREWDPRADVWVILAKRA